MRRRLAAAVLLPVAALALAACGADATPEQAEAGAVATAMDTTRSNRDDLLRRTYVFLCDERFRFEVQLDTARRALIQLPGTRRLLFAPEADTLYTGEEGSLVLFTPPPAEDDTALATTPPGVRARLVADGTPRENCVNQPEEVPWANARFSGVTFRAVGHAPTAWNLDLYKLDSLAVFVTDDGRTRWRIERPRYAVDAAEQRGTYAATLGGTPFEAVLRGEGCTDAKTGERLPTTVRIAFDGRAFEGCGRELN